jgi:hypothetical protein
MATPSSQQRIPKSRYALPVILTRRAGPQDLVGKPILEACRCWRANAVSAIENALWEAAFNPFQPSPANRARDKPICHSRQGR